MDQFDGELNILLHLDKKYVYKMVPQFLGGFELYLYFEEAC